MSTAPPPSTLTLLSNLINFPTGEKVRFLGCVVKYLVKSGHLIVEHAYPPGSELRATVDVNLVLNSMKESETRPGQWLNIIGYVTEPNKLAEEDIPAAYIQATVVWSTGPFKPQIYELSLTESTT